MICCDICGREIKDGGHTSPIDYEIIPETILYIDNRVVGGISGKTCYRCGMDFLYEVISVKDKMKKERWVGNGQENSN